MADITTACEFLKEAGAYYLATADGDQPRVRPFGTANIFEGKLYIQTGLVKDVAKQMAANPKVEICAFKDGKWIRITAEAVHDPRTEAQKSMLDAYPSLQGMYKVDDGNTAVYYLKDAKAVIASFTEAPISFTF
ncbi:MAG: pyridoxamine 5'-phosphate oxidase family protein [Solobacterium sp.]|nr:pyridoxamine 5'-phosphate oxidase family protein [Solobacterium sp.]